MPGDTCLRDDVVTHRCVTCSKNYRCELQTTHDLLDMGKDSVEPWVGEEGTYYQSEQPEPDRANPWFEFDPQMCIICTRCVRTCSDVRHTAAITLAGRGFSTRIAFGAGGPIHDSTCDFCGACIDVCPTATLMEKPNKWIARTEDWISTVCDSCSVGCTISVGHRNGKAAIIKPDTLNPFSDNQICIRGRFHYDALRQDERLSGHLVRRDGALSPASWEEALEHAAERLAQVRQEHGAGSIAFLGSPLAPNEENYLVQRVAREVVGSSHIDFSAGPVNRAVDRVTAAAFGTETLPADLTAIPAEAKTIVVVADDLEESHNVAALRIKDAVDPKKLPVREPARLIVVTPRRGVLCDFADPLGGVWLQPEPGQEPAALAALGRLLGEDDAVGRTASEAGLQIDVVKNGPQAVPGIDDDALRRATEILREAASDVDQHVAVVFAPKPTGVALAAEEAKGAANLALLLRGRDAGRSFYVLPTEANVNGARDMGVSPDAGPGHRPVEGDAGLDFSGMIEGMLQGQIKALVVAGDNPLMFAPARGRIEEALEKLDFLVVVDRVQTDTAERAHVVLADARTYAKDGTFTSADRRVQRLRGALAIPGDGRPAWETLSELGRRLAGRLGVDAGFDYEEAADVTEEIAASVPGYEHFHFYGMSGWGKERAVSDVLPERVELQPVSLPTHPPSGNGEVALLTGRTLYTSHLGSAIHSPEADKLGRERGVVINQYDATELGIAIGDEVVLRNGSAELSLKATLSVAVPRRAVFVSSYYDGGAVTSLLPAENGMAAVPRVKLAKKA
jgi:predicted molibdopterin-dependent oxidoreductase YjgC